MRDLTRRTEGLTMDLGRGQYHHPAELPDGTPVEAAARQGHDEDAIVMDGRLYALLEGWIVAGMTGEFEDVQARPDGLLLTLVDGSSWLLVAHPSDKEA